MTRGLDSREPLGDSSAMSSQADVVSIPAASAAKAIAGLHGDAKLRVDYDGASLQLQVSRRRNRKLVILFHGAVKPERREVVTDFNTAKLAKLLDANVVAVTDPSLACSPMLTAAWYLGHDGFRSQRVLAKLFRQLQERLKIERRIYVGGSAGGFAALYYSWVDPDSVAIAVNPQTSLSRHRASHQATYRDACWPNLPADAQLSTVVHDDLSTLYRKRVPNSVVYLQNSMDAFHLRNHMAPFLGAIRQAELTRVVTEVRFWGVVGHSNSIPRQAWFEWVRAGLEASSTSAVDLLEAHARATCTRDAAPRSHATVSDQQRESDLLVARRLAEIARLESTEAEAS